MSWLAAIWSPDARAVAAVADWVRPALLDQGPYGRGTPFALLAGGGVVAPATEWARLGDRVAAWSVEERLILGGPAVTPPAVTMVSLMRRNPTMTHEEFSVHWAERHAPLAVRRHVGLADYRQCLVIEALTADLPGIDGIALLGFATRADFEARFFDSDAGRAEIMADVARFMDRPGPETTLVGPAEPVELAG